MPSLKAIRKRIVSTKATQKITRAMKMVAGARLTRAQQRIVAMRPYAVKTGDVLRSVARTMAASAESENQPVHPLLARRPEEKALVLLFTADRGLCGGLNTNANKAAERLLREKKGANVDVTFVTLGRKGKDYLTRRSAKLEHDFARAYDNLDLEKARLVARWLVPRFQKGHYDSVYMIYNEFKSAIVQRVTIDQLLPLAEGSGEESAGRDALAPTDFLYEPNQHALLERLVPMYVEISIFRALLESQASFFGAQMSAMDAATRNAKELIARFTLEYNRARQAGITKELMEIVGGAEALKE
jgi:F-type H+-transporting ATPase subunit gamma